MSEAGVAMTDTQVHMPAAPESTPRQGWAYRFFGVVAEGRTWLNAVYLLLSFPLGLLYFVVLVTGAALGISLVILWVGIPILLMVMAAWWAFAALERRLADGLLGTSCGPSPRPWEADEQPLARMKAALSHGSTWKGLAFSLLKFPFGVVSFAVVTGAVGIAEYLIMAPIWTALTPDNGGPSVFGWRPEHWYTALPLVAAGVLAFFVGLHAVNALATGWRYLAEALLAETPRVGADAVPGPAASPAPPLAPSPGSRPAPAQPADHLKEEAP